MTSAMEKGAAALGPRLCFSFRSASLAAYFAPAFCAYSHDACDSGTVRLAVSIALADAAVPSRMRPAMPCGDAGEPEQVVGEVPVEVRNVRPCRWPCSRSRSPRSSVGMLSALQIDALQPRHGPLHQQIGEVGHRIAERRQLPVEHRLHARLGRVEDHVVEPVVAVHDRRPAPAPARCAAAIRSAGPSPGSVCVSEALYCLVQRSTWRAK